ncbi:putative 4-deoxy-4-formamido-L-arabinose-phosphoundecaprenol deformylase ArnD [Ferrovum sp. JA12]|nr:putative 4-deoxy-4-formamido-L-arabinose-phosphoundecaprenol deformylase ArnD [Ferrovum sp. JA12]
MPRGLLIREKLAIVTTMTAKIILKIDVDTLRGTLEGVPNLLKCFNAHKVPATFLFSLGPDNTGRAIKRVFRPGFLNKVSRTSVFDHYGLKTLLYGTLLPAPDIGVRARSIIQHTAAQGFDVGIHTWDHITWQDGIKEASNAHTLELMNKALQRIEDILGKPCTIHGAAGWQMNDFAYQWLDTKGFKASSDCRGAYPFLPMIHGKPLNCPQLPTTLPTLDELIGLNQLDASNVAQHILSHTETSDKALEVFTLHAELEGMKLLSVLDQLITGWKKQKYTFVTMSDYASQITDPLPWCEINWAEVPGRSGSLMCQNTNNHLISILGG